ncbi:MAG: hypothetical protein MK077_09185 [Phycisphaerales bacterium]|nr:hypothetical protein [Phycisphaerales bacterium]
MKRVVLSASVMMMLMMGGCGSAVRGQATPLPATGMINDTCPFSGQPVGPGAPEATLADGRAVGFCCGGCAQRWTQWDSEQQQQYVQAQAH